MATILRAYERQYTPLDSKVFIIGIDGATWDIIDPMIEQGRLPHLSRLIKNGSSARMRSLKPTKSPALWTTMATGKLPAKHGILDFLAVAPGGETKVSLVSSYHRQVPALWNISSFFGLRVGFAGWWATYPAEEVNGFIVSDQTSTIRRAAMRKMFKLEEETEGHREQDVYPPGFYRQIQAFFRQPKDLSNEEVLRFANLPSEEIEKLKTTPLDRRVPMSVVMRAYLLDGAMFNICINQIRERGMNLVGLWVGGVDASEHLFWQYFRPRDFKQHVPDAKLVKKYSQVIPNYYSYIDEWIGRSLESLDPSWTVMVVSDHGHHAQVHFGSPDIKEYFVLASGEHEDAPDGIFILSGQHARKGGDRAKKVALADVAPTTLYLLGIPVGEDMDGTVALEFLDESFLAAHPVGIVPTLDILPWKPRKTSPLPEVDAETLEKLQALGYIGDRDEPEENP